MRSGTNCIINSGQVHSWSLGLLLDAKLVKDHGWKCTATIVLGIALRAAARCISVSAACRDLARAPSDQAVMTALDEGLPKTLLVLERRLNDALIDPLPRRMRRRAWNVAIDWHLQPYYGQPFQSRNELYYGQPKLGTTKFHAYASACIVEYGRRYTLVLTWVRRHESMVRVLRRMVTRIREIGLKIRRLLLDRAFFNGAVVAFLQEEDLPFVMPVVIRGGAPEKGHEAHRPSLDQASAGQLVSACDETREATVEDFGMCWLSPAPQPKGRQAAAPEVVVRSVARTRFSHRNPRTVPPAVRHRNKLPSDAAGADLHLHAQSSPAAVLSDPGDDSAEPLGMDSSHSPRRRIGRYPDIAPGTATIQTNARMDRPRDRRPISRRLNTLRHSAAVDQTWNY